MQLQTCMQTTPRTSSGPSLAHPGGPPPFIPSGPALPIGLHMACRCESLSDTAYQDDAVILAGDICDSLTIAEQVMRHLLVCQFLSPSHSCCSTFAMAVWVPRSMRQLRGPHVRCGSWSAAPAVTIESPRAQTAQKLARGVGPEASHLGNGFIRLKGALK